MKGAQQSPDLGLRLPAHLSTQIIFADILIGNPLSPDGLIPELIPGIELGSPLLDRRVVLSALSAALLLPLSLKRDLASLASLNAVGVASVAAFAASTSIVAAAAVLQVR